MPTIRHELESWLTRLEWELATAVGDAAMADLVEPLMREMVLVQRELTATAASGSSGSA